MKIICCKIGLHNWKKLYDDGARVIKVCKECGTARELDKACSNWNLVAKVEPPLHGKVKIYKDGAGALFVYNEETDSCYGLAPHNYLGTMEEQCATEIIGEYAIAYTK